MHACMHAYIHTYIHTWQKEQINISIDRRGGRWNPSGHQIPFRCASGSFRHHARQFEQASLLPRPRPAQSEKQFGKQISFPAGAISKQSRFFKSGGFARTKRYLAKKGVISRARNGNLSRSSSSQKRKIKKKHVLLARDALFFEPANLKIEGQIEVRLSLTRPSVFDFFLNSCFT